MHADYTPKLRAQYDNMLACIRCGQCLPSCPTYLETHHEEESPRGRIAMARAYLEGHLTLTPDLLAHEDSCLLCDACSAVCPAGVRMEPIGLALRATVEGPRGRPLAERALRWFAFRVVLGDLGLLRLFTGLLRVAQRLGIGRLIGPRLIRWGGLSGALGLLPAVPDRFLVPEGQRWEPREPRAGSAALFAGCVMSTLFAPVQRATVRVLLAHGMAVTVPPGQGCCGALQAHNGDLAGARRLARRNVRAFVPDGEPAPVAAADADRPIVVTAAGCGAFLKHYGELMAGDPLEAAAAALAGRVRDLSEALAPLDAPAEARPLPCAVTYQEACHLAHAQRVSEPPRRLLRRLPGVRLVEMQEPALCCGSAGIYNVLHPEMADALLERKLGHIEAAGADVVVTTNPGCMLQLLAGLRRRASSVRVVHLAELLDEAYGEGEPS
ncbi:MAG: (Fe-S)-binding protein [Chloroflexi bacterium]|nr:(Fe-S)-binding protein [Chloroflexota bacterium]